MALSTPASGIKLGGGLRPPSDTSPQERSRGEGPRSNETSTAARSSDLWRDALRRLRKNRLAMGGGVVILLLCLDRKSTRLNSSHRCISYAVFCLKKKTP